MCVYFQIVDLAAGFEMIPQSLKKINLKSYSLFEFTLLPEVFLHLALPGQVVVVLAALGERDEEVRAVVSHGERDLFPRHLLLAHFHLYTEEVG